MTPFGLIQYFIVSVPNKKFLGSTVPDILGGPKISKVGHVGVPFDLIFNKI